MAIESSGASGPIRHYSDRVRYKTVWVQQSVSFTMGAVLECPSVDSVVNEAAAAGWSLHSLAPGTNAQSYHGLFVTFERPN